MVRRSVLLLLFPLASALAGLSACGDGGGGSGGAGADGGTDGATADASKFPNIKCLELHPSASLYQGSTECKSDVGKWTKYQYDPNPPYRYNMGCNEDEADIPETQAQYDREEAHSSTPGTRIVSNKDFQRGATCASGTSQLIFSDHEEKHATIWVKQL